MEIAASMDGALRSMKSGRERDDVGPTETRTVDVFTGEIGCMPW
jgi:hypothetical protein